MSSYGQPVLVLDDGTPLGVGDIALKRSAIPQADSA
jgi:hypothetical protein